MSALAARRAAATLSTADAIPAAAEVFAPARDRPDPARSMATSSTASSSLTLEQPLNPSGKRQRVDKLSEHSSGYYHTSDKAEVEGGIKAIKSKREARLSPSLPDDNEDDGDGADSSLDGDDLDQGDDPRVLAEEDVDEGTFRWFAPVTPSTRNSTGPSRQHARIENETTPSTSGFEPQRGTNLQQVSEADLRTAGLDEAKGPGILISLAKNENLMIAGSFTVTPLQQSLCVFSTTLHPSIQGHAFVSYPVSAPTSHPLPVISSVPDAENLGPKSSPLLSRLALPSSFRLHNPGHRSEFTIFLLRELQSGLAGLRDGAVPGFSGIWLEERGAWGLRGVHPVIGSFSSPVYPYITPPSWEVALSTFDRSSVSRDEDEPSEPRDPIVALVKGSKRVGKSTFGRAALNRLLLRYDQVAWLECDLGQGEFGCGGVVGIWTVDQPVLGPAFSHPSIPQRAHYLGTYTPLTCPDEYIAAIRHLITYFRYEVQYPSTGSGSDSVPLVINTQGWVKGLGEDLLQAIEAMAEPTHVFAFDSPPVVDHGVHDGAGWTSSPPRQGTELLYTNGHVSTHTPTHIHRLEPAPTSPLQSRYTSSDLRVLSMMSYFHANLESQTWDFSMPLITISPLQVELGITIEQVILVGEGADGVVDDDLPIALNSSVVALLETIEPLDGPVYVQGDPYPSLDGSNFLGLALVRGVDTSGHQITLHLMSPLPASVLSSAKIIVKNGAIELPLCGMLDWRSGAVSEDGLVGVKWEDVPFLDLRGEDVVGGERRRFRRNLMRKGV